MIFKKIEEKEKVILKMNENISKLQDEHSEITTEVQ